VDSQGTVVIIMARRLFVSLSLLLLALSLARAAHAQGPDDLAGWQVLATDVRVTFYGDQYIGDRTEFMASGVPYTKDGDTASLGPTLLYALWRHYYHQAEALGNEMTWGWGPGLKMWQSGNIAGCYHVPVTLEKGRLWGCGIRVCAETAGGGWLCQELRVMDTGGADPENGIELGVDLPDETWARWGFGPEKGVITGAVVEVLQWVQQP
jgi:hypothetical protein